jgi:hypothetical protein
VNFSPGSPEQKSKTVLLLSCFPSGGFPLIRHFLQQNLPVPPVRPDGFAVLPSTPGVLGIFLQGHPSFIAVGFWTVPPQIIHPEVGIIYA